MTSWRSDTIRYHDIDTKPITTIGLKSSYNISVSDPRVKRTGFPRLTPVAFHPAQAAPLHHDAVRYVNV